MLACNKEVFLFKVKSSVVVNEHYRPWVRDNDLHRPFRFNSFIGHDGKPSKVSAFFLISMGSAVRVDRLGLVAERPPIFRNSGRVINLCLEVDCERS